MNVKHSINHKAFDILSEEAEYWLGFLAADATIKMASKNNGVSTYTNSIDVCISHADKFHLEKLREFLSSSAPITHRAKLSASRLCVNSKYMVSRINDLGITQNKTSTIVVDDALAASKNFWRGVVDGDGYIALKCVDRPSPQAIFDLVSGSRAFLEQFQAFLPNDLRVPTLFSNTVSKETMSFRTRSRKAFLVIQLLYDGANVFLDRKMETYEKIKEAYQKIVPKKCPNQFAYNNQPQRPVQAIFEKQ